MVIVFIYRLVVLWMIVGWLLLLWFVGGDLGRICWMLLWLGRDWVGCCVVCGCSRVVEWLLGFWWIFVLWLGWGFWNVWWSCCVLIWILIDWWWIGCWRLVDGVCVD